MDFLKQKYSFLKQGKLPLQMSSCTVWLGGQAQAPSGCKVCPEIAQTQLSRWKHLEVASCPFKPSVSQNSLFWVLQSSSDSQMESPLESSSEKYLQ